MSRATCISKATSISRAACISRATCISHILFEAQSDIYMYSRGTYIIIIQIVKIKLNTYLTAFTN